MRDFWICAGTCFAFLMGIIWGSAGVYWVYLNHGEVWSSLVGSSLGALYFSIAAAFWWDML